MNDITFDDTTVEIKGTEIPVAALNRYYHEMFGNGGGLIEDYRNEKKEAVCFMELTDFLVNVFHEDFKASMKQVVNFIKDAARSNYD